MINGVFLVALCATIALEALGRIIDPPTISNPKLIVIIGSLGLLSNIVGLFLFHGEWSRCSCLWTMTDMDVEHGHSHGHSHGEIALPADGATEALDGNKQARRERAGSMSSLYQHPAQTRAQVIETAQEFGYGRNEESTGFMGAMSPPTHHRASSQSRRNKARFNRQSNGNVIAALSGTDGAPHGDGSSSPSASTAVADSPELTPVPSRGANGKRTHAKDADHAEQGHGSHDHDHSHENGKGHDDHDHSSGGGGGHGHSHGGHDHGSMNMRGVFLHVLGDA